uniref:DUF3192 domain-containing protein n=1 Tax=Desulfobacca acetoxidans TaxID=60893 RepID=A0A7V4G9Z8_9BACT
MTYLVASLCLVLLALGCGETVLTQWPRQEIFSSYFRLQELRLGMSREEVEGIMGPPQVREEGEYRRGHYIFYFYRTHNMDYEGSGTVRGGYTPLLFQDNRLVGMGKRDYLKAVDRPWSEEGAPSRWPGRSW